MFVVSETLYRARLWTVQTAFAQSDGLTGSIFSAAPATVRGVGQTHGVWEAGPHGRTRCLRTPDNTAQRHA